MPSRTLSIVMKRLPVILVFIAACWLTAAEAWAQGVDAGTLARVEQELSVPICGVGYLDSRQQQLDGIVAGGQVPYLTRMARGSYAKDKRSLPNLAVQLLARNKSAAAMRALRGLVGDEQVAFAPRELAARELAVHFRDATGRDLLLGGLAAPGVQRRADSLSALLPVARPQDLAAVLPLGHDPKFYVVDRLVTELGKRPGLRQGLVAKWVAKAKKATADERGRIALTLVLLGERRHLAQASGWLMQHPPVTVDDDLYQLGQAAQALAKRGHKVGLDAALRLFAGYRGPRPATWEKFVLHLFFQHTAALDAWRQLPAAESHRKLEAFWKRERDRVRFNAATSRFE